MVNDALFSIPLTRIDGSQTTLASYEGKVALIVNVASKCGLTPQYQALEAIYQRYKDQGFVVLGFPANDFAGQEPGTPQEIQQFCSLNYGVTFPLFAKTVVLGPHKHPLYQQLTQALPKAQSLRPESAEKTAKDSADIRWNFEKFLLNRSGQVIARFAPDVVPDADMITKAIAEALS